MAVPAVVVGGFKFIGGKALAGHRDTPFTQATADYLQGKLDYYAWRGPARGHQHQPSMRFLRQAQTAVDNWYGGAVAAAAPLDYGYAFPGAITPTISPAVEDVIRPRRRRRRRKRSKR